MVPLQQVMNPVVAELLHRGPISAEKISFAWRIAVGSQLAKVTSVQAAPSGRLQVTASDDRWRREIERSAALILARLRSLLGSDAVARIDVICGRPLESRISNPESR